MSDNNPTAFNLLANAVWNTNRCYTEAGQRISALILEDGRVAFCDIDRQIAGITQASCKGPNGDRQPVTRELIGFVMQEYDYCAYIGWEPGIDEVFRSLRLAALDAPLLDPRCAGY